MYPDFLIQAFSANEPVRMPLRQLHINQVLLDVTEGNIHVFHRLEHRKQMPVLIGHKPL